MKKAEKDTNVVQLKRSKTGLDFSLKGGKEHGIPIIVSDVESKGAAGMYTPVEFRDPKLRIGMIVK